MDTLIKFDGYDDAIIGVTDSWSGGERVDRLVYAGEKLVEILVDQGMPEEDVHEFIEFNIAGAFVGEQTPVIVWQINVTDLQEEVMQ